MITEAEKARLRSILTCISVTLPLRTINAKNTREHWSKRARRTAEERMVAAAAVRAELRKPRGTPFSAPWTVKLTRLSPGLFDSHDNLRLALSGCVDGVADALGIKDNDPRVRWEYDQKKTKRFTPGRQAPNRYVVHICIEAAT